jgi:16S rRNA (guanine966-N2)-methyltransferase
MRVIAGSAKGRRLGPVPPGVRPVSDRAREGLFSSLAGRVVEARCLDLFAGTGAVGIEALSRGASVCRFVDRSRGAAAAIRENLRKTGLADRATVVTADVLDHLRRGPGDEEPADLVFLDPPYELEGSPLDACLAALDRGWLAPPGWTVVVTRGHKSSLPGVPLHWAAGRQLRYGDSLLTLYREDRWA